LCDDEEELFLVPKILLLAVSTWSSLLTDHHVISLATISSHEYNGDEYNRVSQSSTRKERIVPRKKNGFWIVGNNHDGAH